MPQCRLFTTVFLICLLMASTAAGSGKPETWRQRAEQDARDDGYRILTLNGYDEILQSGKPHLLVDVRPGYEFRSGHIPDAVNLEFDLGDRTSLSPEKAAMLEDLLGPDKDRAVVFYCRSFA